MGEENLKTVLALLSHNGFSDNHFIEGIPKMAETTGVKRWHHVVAGWPILLVVIGGCVGGLLGAGAYSVSMVVFASNLSTPVKVMISLGIGFLAFLIWLILALMLTGAFRQ